MRKVVQGSRVKSAGYYTGVRAGKARVQSMNPKFHPGEDPIEREQRLGVIMPTDKQQLEQMTRMLEKEFSGDPKKQQALELWKIQVAEGLVTDQVKLDFLRRFHMWLLGRGTQEDHKKTMWGRANAAVYNREVAGYIDMFIDKRKQWVLKLLSLSNNVPDTLLGYYLYFKYIVNGGLQQKQIDGVTVWDMSDEDYLQDYDLFQQVFQEERKGLTGEQNPKYFDLAAGLHNNGTFGKGGVPGPINHEQLLENYGKAPPAALQEAKVEERNEEALRKSLSLGPDGKLPKRGGAGFLGRGAKKPDDDNDDDGNVGGGVTNQSNAISSGEGAGSAALNVEAETGGTQYYEGGFNETYLKHELAAIDEIMANEKLTDEQKERLAKQQQALREYFEAKKPKPPKEKEEAHESPKTPKKGETTPKTPASESSGAQQVPLTPSPIAKVEQSPGIDTPATPFTPARNLESEMAEVDVKAELSAEIDKALAESVTAVQEAVKEMTKEIRTTGAAPPDALRNIREIVARRRELERLREELGLSSSSVGSQLNVTPPSRIAVAPELIGRSAEVSLSSDAVEGSSVSSEDLRKQADEEEKRALRDVVDLANVSDDSEPSELDNTVSDLIRRSSEISSTRSASTSETPASSMSDESSSSISLAKDVSDAEKYEEDVGDKAGKVTKYGDIVTKHGTEQEVRDLYEFIKLHEGKDLTPVMEDLSIKHKWVKTRFMEGYENLQQFMDKHAAKDLSAEDKKALRLALHHAFSKLNGYWSDVANATNIAVKRNVDGTFDARFYEGGRRKGDMPDFRRQGLDYLIEFFTQQNRRFYADRSFRRVYGDLL